MSVKSYPADRPLLITTSFNCERYEQSEYKKRRDDWAHKNDYRHLYVSESSTGLSLDAHASAWLRIPLMKALKGNLLFYLDHDCLIAEDCPRPELLTGGLDGLFIARGHSGRPNSGVIVISRKGSEVLDFCIDHVAHQVPASCEAPYENGHVIWACTWLPWRPLPQWMNDTSSSAGKVIHHTGPNRHLRNLVYRHESNKRFDFSAEMINSPASLTAMADVVLNRLGY